METSRRVLFHGPSCFITSPISSPAVRLTALPPATFLIPVSGHDFSGNTFYEILLTVTDSSGLASSTSVSVYPRKVNLSFQSSPSGLQLNIDGIPFVTPFVRDALISFRHTIEAPNQSQGGNSYVFGSWSDGGPSKLVSEGILKELIDANVSEV